MLSQLCLLCQNFTLVTEAMYLDDDDDAGGGGGGGGDGDDDDDDDDDALPEGKFIGFVPHGDEMSEVVSRCLPHRQLWVSNLSKVITQWFEIYSNLRTFGYKAQNIPLHYCIPLCMY